MNWKEKENKQKEDQELEKLAKQAEVDRQRFEEFCIALGRQINKLESLPKNQGQGKQTVSKKKNDQADQERKKLEELRENQEKENMQLKQQFKVYNNDEERQALEKKVKEMDEIYCQQKPHNYLNLFGVDRGRCFNPKCTLSKCSQYRGSYNIETFRSIELFSCLECGCPMNRHVIEETAQSFENDLSELLSNKYIESQHLNFKSLVGIFFSFNSETGKRIGFVDKSRKDLNIGNPMSMEVNLEKFVQILNEGSFDILSYYELDLLELKEKLIEKKVFSQKQPVSKEEFNDIYSFIKQVLKAEKKSNQEAAMNEKKGQKYVQGKRTQNITNNVNDSYLKQYERYKEKIENKLKRIGPNTDIKIYILLINSKFTNPYMQFRRFLVAAKEALPPEMHYYYSSKYKYKGIIDSQIFFPQFFEINISTFVITQHMPARMIIPLKGNQMLGNQEDKQKNTQVIKEYYENLNLKFKDYLDFNSFEIIQDEFKQLTDEEIIQAFSFMDVQNDYVKVSAKFLEYCSAQFDRISLKIAAKIGPPTFTQISQNPINFYRISDPFENLKILNKFCDSLGRSQRVCLILRPITVRSNIEELILNVYRLNHFIIIKRVFKLLNQTEAELLAKIEGITPDNIQTYIKSMRDGLISIVLLSKPGAQSQAKLLANGCSEGLKMQKTQFLDELFIEHQTESKIKFKEKLPKEFYNVYQSYSNLNIFSGLKEFFNLERLIFVDDNYADEVQNMYVQEETNQVFFKPPSEIKFKYFSSRKRTKIMEAINSESFNFFIYTSQDDNSTEQIVTMFMPDCSLMQNVLVIIKPEQSIANYKKIFFFIFSFYCIIKEKEKLQISCKELDTKSYKMNWSRSSKQLLKICQKVQVYWSSVNQKCKKLLRNSFSQKIFFKDYIFY